MMAMHHFLNSDLVLFELREFVSVLHSINNNAAKNEYTEKLNIDADFQHALNHLCGSWHVKWMKTEYFNQLTRDDFLKLTTWLPKWDNVKLLGPKEMYEFYSINGFAITESQNLSLLKDKLDSNIKIVTSFIEDIEARRMDYSDTSTLVPPYLRTLRSLVACWHSITVAPIAEKIRSPWVDNDSVVIVPNWYGSFVLVDIDQPIQFQQQ